MNLTDSLVKGVPYDYSKGGPPSFNVAIQIAMKMKDKWFPRPGTGPPGTGPPGTLSAKPPSQPPVTSWTYWVFLYLCN